MSQKLFLEQNLPPGEMKTENIAPRLASMNCLRGAPMGRRESHREDLLNTEVSLHLQYIPFFDGAYDEGGAYWGYPANLYRAINADLGIEMFVRANWRADAETRVRSIYTKATFIKLTSEDMTDFAKGYIHAALWSSTDENGEPLEDKNVSVLSLPTILSDCWDFQTANAELLKESGLAEDAQGHDFWLTRNGHGAGFWDRGLGVVGTKLTAAAKVYSSVDLWVDAEGDVNGW